MTSTIRPPVNNKREIFGWAMFDWAISAFSTTVITVFLGPYLSSITRAAADANGMIYLLGVPIRYDSYFTYLISASVLLQVTFLPILGALADYSHLRKRLMQIFSTLGAVSTISLFFITPGLHWLGGLLFLIANLAFGAAMVFYNSYLPPGSYQLSKLGGSGFFAGLPPFLRVDVAGGFFAAGGSFEGSV